MTNYVRRMGDGLWELRAGAETNPATGRRRQRATTIEAPDRETAEALLVDFMLLVTSQREDPPASVHELLGRWWAATCVTRSPQRDRAVRKLLRNRLQPALAGLPLDALTGDHIGDVYAAVLEDGGSYDTLRQVHQIVVPAIEMAVDRGWLTRSPLDDLAPVGSDPPDIDDGQPEQLVEDLIQSAPVALAAYARLVAVTAASQTEVAALRWCDVDLDAGTVTFAGTVDIRTTPPSYLPYTPERTVTIDGATVEFLRSLDRAGPFLWPHADTTDAPMSPRTWTSRWTTHARRHRSLLTLSDLHAAGGWRRGS